MPLRRSSSRTTGAILMTSGRVPTMTTILYDIDASATAAAVGSGMPRLCDVNHKGHVACLRSYIFYVDADHANTRSATPGRARHHRGGVDCLRRYLESGNGAAHGQGRACRGAFA